MFLLLMENMFLERSNTLFLCYNLRVMKNRKFLLIVFCLVLVSVLSLTIAYATLSAALTINGGADVVAATWDVHFENETVVNKLSNDSLYDYEVSNMAVWGCVPQVGIDCIAKDSNLKINFFN